VLGHDQLAVERSRNECPTGLPGIAETTGQSIESIKQVTRHKGIGNSDVLAVLMLCCEPVTIYDSNSQSSSEAGGTTFAQQYTLTGCFISVLEMVAQESVVPSQSAVISLLKLPTICQRPCHAYKRKICNMQAGLQVPY
jgi:hypothetical protein